MRTCGANRCSMRASLALLNGRQYRQPNRLATAYFHGKPGTGVAEFDRAFEALRGCHDRLDRVQVSHREMRDIVLSSGIDAAKVHLIPIAVDPRALLLADSAAEGRRARGPRHSRGSGRRRIVSEGRRRLGRRRRAEAREGARCVPGGDRSAAPRGARSVRAALRTVAWLRAERPGAHERSLPARVSRRSAGGGAAVSRPRRLSRVVTPGRRPEGGARVDGRRSAAGDHARGTGHRSRAARRERMDGGRRGRRLASRGGLAQRCARGPRSTRSLPRGAARPRPTATRRSCPRGRGSSTGSWTACRLDQRASPLSPSSSRSTTRPRSWTSRWFA